jgi:hypothetical protein
MHITAPLASAGGVRLLLWFALTPCLRLTLWSVAAASLRGARNRKRTNQFPITLFHCVCRPSRLSCNQMAVNYRTYTGSAKRQCKCHSERSEESLRSRPQEGAQLPLSMTCSDFFQIPYYAVARGYPRRVSTPRGYPVCVVWRVTQRVPGQKGHSRRRLHRPRTPTA